MPSKYDRNHPDVLEAKARVVEIIDSVPPEELVRSIKRAPSLRGMILGYIAEEMFEQYVPKKYGYAASDIEKHDDHNRAENKSDRTITVEGLRYRIQLKSIQTNSIKYDKASGLLLCDVQNDASDSRAIQLPSGQVIATTCYQRGDYDILAVPLFPFTGSWTFAYLLNSDCRASSSKKYSEEARRFLLSTTEQISWPLSDKWTTDLNFIIKRAETAVRSRAIPDPLPEITEGELPTMVLPLKNKKI